LSKELFIDVQDNDIRIALSNERELIELHNEKLNKNYLVGDIYLGKIKKIMSGLNATFVDVQYERDAFLHYLDLGPNVNSLISFLKRVRSGQRFDPLLRDFKLEPEILKSGKITEVVGKQPLLPVQIVKEPIANKGPRLSSEISFAGRYLVLVPFSEGVSISKKIKS
jgi:ribonuclease G